MGKLAKQLELKSRPGMTIPEPLRSLYDEDPQDEFAKWVNANK